MLNVTRGAVPGARVGGVRAGILPVFEGTERDIKKRLRR